MRKHYITFYWQSSVIILQKLTSSVIFLYCLALSIQKFLTFGLTLAVQVWWIAEQHKTIIKWSEPLQRNNYFSRLVLSYRNYIFVLLQWYHLVLKLCEQKKKWLKERCPDIPFTEGFLVLCVSTFYAFSSCQNYISSLCHVHLPNVMLCL